MAIPKLLPIPFQPASPTIIRTIIKIIPDKHRNKQKIPKVIHDDAIILRNEVKM